MRFDFKYFDWLFFAAAVFLSLLGLMMIYSIRVSDAGNVQWVRQLAALGLGLLGLFFLSNLDYHYFQKNANIFYIFSIALLILVLLFGQEIRGSHRWFNFGAFNFQPSEFSKFSLIFLLAKFFQNKAHLLKNFGYVLLSGLYALLPTALILFQPDFGSAALHMVLWLGLLFLSPMPKRFYGYLLIVFLILGILLWQFVFLDYQKARLNSFLNPTADPLGRGYNVIQSIVAVGSGGLLGRGLARGIQSNLKFLPERQTDFVFASLVEELGLAGGVLVLAVLTFLLWRILRTIKFARDSFGGYAAGGIFFIIFTQSVVNIGMNLGLLPVTGVTLPFLSYGGSSLMITLWLLGVVENIFRKSEPVKFA